MTNPLIQATARGRHHQRLKSRQLLKTQLHGLPRFRQPGLLPRGRLLAGHLAFVLFEAGLRVGWPCLPVAAP